MFGVNILGDYKKAFELAGKYDADFIQIDSVCGHLTPEQDSPYADELMTLMEDRTFQVLGGLRFKYQPIRSGRTLEKDAELARQRCDALVTTGEGTGKNCPTEKLFEFRKVLKDFPLIVGAGVTAGNVCEKLEYVDGVIIGSWLKEGHNDYGDVCEEYVKEFMDKVVECRATLSYWAVQLFEKGIGISYIEETRRFVYPLLRKAKLAYPDEADILFVLKYHMTSVVNSIEATIQAYENH